MRGRCFSSPVSLVLLGCVSFFFLFIYIKSITLRQRLRTSQQLMDMRPVTLTLPVSRQPLSTSRQQTATPKARQQGTLADYVWKKCQQENGAWYAEQSRPYRNMLVDDKHKVLYCYIPKVACSNWKRVILVLLGKVSPENMTHVNPHLGRMLHAIPTLSRFNASQQQYRLDNYFKFMFVRDPFERLLSAWRNKFQSNQTTNVVFRRGHVRAIVSRYRERLTRARGIFSIKDIDDVRISFDEFLHYALDQVESWRRANEHWNLFHRLCHPCSVRYDFVGKYESLQADVAQVLKQANLIHLVRFPERSEVYKDPKTSLYVQQYYTALSEQMLKRVYKVFQRDFLLFNYSVPEYLRSSLL